MSVRSHEPPPPASAVQPWPNDPPLGEGVLRAHKISGEEYARIEQALGRAPTYTELGVFSVMWSEHCSYKSSRFHLRRLPTKGPRVIQGPGENAGVVDIGDGFAAVFKMESHNHPSFIEPYQGAATGVGGILRDVFTMGARPIASLNSLRFGRPDHPRTPELVRGVVAGIGGYGNCIGVPTVGGEVQFHSRYDGNILVNAFTCGVARTDRIFYGRATGIGNSILYIGAKTGRDGIHGATMASDEFSAGGPSQRPTMQVGDPFLGKLLLEACLELFSTDALEGIQDMGAAGLTSSSVEMAGRAQNGIELDLDAIPRRAKAMSPYEILLSESQERMLLVAKPGREAEVIAICKKWDLDAAVVGRVTDTKRWVIKATPGYDPLAKAAGADDAVRAAKREPIVVCDLPIGALTDDAPVYDRPRKTVAAARSLPPIAVPDDFSSALLRLLGSPNVGSRQWIVRQYDHIVRGGTVVRPGADAAVVRVPCDRDGIVVEKLLAFSVDCNGRFVELDPFVGAAMAVAEVCRNLVVSGAEPIGITDCLNFGNPERPEIMETFARAIDGLAAGCTALGVPIVSGNVSLYNETDGRAVLPTPTVAAVGLVHRREDIVTPPWKGEGDRVYLLGNYTDDVQSLSGSEYLCMTGSAASGNVPGGALALDLDAEARLQKLVLELTREGGLRSAHDVSDGGLAVALAECCASSLPGAERRGVDVTLPPCRSGQAQVAALFGEAPSRVIVSVNATEEAHLVKRAAEAGVQVARLGTVTGNASGDDVLSVRFASDTSDGDAQEVIRLRGAELAEARESCLRFLDNKS